MFSIEIEIVILIQLLTTRDRHVRLKHGIGATPNPTTCEHCGYYNADWGRLRDHVNHKHTKEKLYSCEQCPHTTYSVYSFRSHKSQHKREDATLREFQCGECHLSYRHDFRFSSQQSLLSVFEEQIFFSSWTKYRVTHHLESYLSLTSEQKFRFSIDSIY